MPLQDENPIDLIRKARGEFDDPMEGSADEARKTRYTESQIAGDYIRRTFTWTPGQLEMIRSIAHELRLSENKAAKWLMDQGIQQYVEGARPDLDQETQLEPRLKEW